MTPVQRLEHHLAREFVANYINQALTRSRQVAINPHAIFMAARLSGLRITTRTLEAVLLEMQGGPTG